MALTTPDIAAQLRSSAIRARRTSWHDADILADEVWLILSSLQGQDTGPLRVNDPVDGSDEFEDISFPDTNFPPADWAFPEAPVVPDTEFIDDVDGDPPGTPTTTVKPEEETREITSHHWVRTIVPGQVTEVPAEGEGGMGGTYQMKLFPHGDLTSSARNRRRDTVLETTVEVENRSTTSLSVGDWALVWTIAEVVETTTETRRGEYLLDRHTSVGTAQQQYLLFPGGGGGGSIGITTGTISASSGTTLGSGSVDKYTIVDGELSLVSSGEVVYNTVPSSVQTGRVIQMKDVAGNLVVDVEACESEEEE